MLDLPFSGGILNIFSRLKNFFRLPLVKFFVWIMDKKSFLKALGKKPNVLIYNSLNEKKKILLIALFEKGYLRDDIVNLVTEAKRQEYYVVGINTLKLINCEENLKGLFDAYIERPNYGRDFGSYKEGITFLSLKNIFVSEVDRLVICNDSVFYESSRVDLFLEQLGYSDFEVLGATENSEIQFHLGSFCVSLSTNIFMNKKFNSFWKNYRLSDIRPVVIRNGEMALSKCLIGCATSMDKVDTLYNVRKFRAALYNSEFLDFVITNSRQSERVDWPTFDVVEHLSSWVRQNLGINFYKSLGGKKAAGMKERFLSSDISLQLNSTSDIKKMFENLGVEDSIFLNYMEDLKSYLLSLAMKGSQIHQNALLFFKMGLPLVKLDSIYRGMLNERDFYLFKNEMSEKDFLSLEKIMLNKPFGGEYLLGWQRLAFFHGLI